jgi:uncharacterized protein with FMN-binding domain
MKIWKLSALVLLVGMLLSDCQMMREFRQRINAIEIENIDLQQVADGEYEGEYDAAIVKARVKVIVKDHRIVDIELLQHENGRGKPAEVIPAQVVAAQSLQVDTISKATYSSKVILEAIEQALRKGLTQPD